MQIILKPECNARSCRVGCAILPKSGHSAGVENGLVGLCDLYEFDLVPAESGAVIAHNQWLSIQHHLLHLQPAKSVELVGDPPTSIHVVAIGGAEVAPQLLADVGRLAGKLLRVQIQKN